MVFLSLWCMWRSTCNWYSKKATASGQSPWKKFSVFFPFSQKLIVIQMFEDIDINIVFSLLSKGRALWYLDSIWGTPGRTWILHLGELYRILIWQSLSPQTGPEEYHQDSKSGNSSPFIGLERASEMQLQFRRTFSLQTGSAIYTHHCTVLRLSSPLPPYFWYSSLLFLISVHKIPFS